MVDLGIANLLKQDISQQYVVEIVGIVEYEVLEEEQSFPVLLKVEAGQDAHPINFLLLFYAPIQNSQAGDLGGQQRYLLPALQLNYFLQPPSQQTSNLRMVHTGCRLYPESPLFANHTPLENTLFLLQL